MIINYITVDIATGGKVSNRSIYQHGGSKAYLLNVSIASNGVVIHMPEDCHFDFLIKENPRAVKGIYDYHGVVNKEGAVTIAIPSTFVDDKKGLTCSLEFRNMLGRRFLKQMFCLEFKKE